MPRIQTADDQSDDQQHQRPREPARVLSVQPEPERRPEQVTQASAARPLVMALSAGELDLVETGLKLLLAASEREEHHAAPIRAILARLSRAEADYPQEAAAAAR